MDTKCPYDPQCGSWNGQCAGDPAECTAKEQHGQMVAASVCIIAAVVAFMVIGLLLLKGMRP